MEKRLQQGIDQDMVLMGKYTGGKPIRFLWKLFRQTKDSLVLTQVVSKWEKNPEQQILTRWLRKRQLWPVQKTQLVNIAITLHKDFGYALEVKTLRVARKIQKNFGCTIDKYIKQKKMSILQHRYDSQQTIIRYNKQEAFQEQLAQGYIHIKEFKDYDSDSRHSISLIDENYIYPYNFGWGLTTKIHVTESPKLVGVAGYTRYTQ